MTTDECEFVLSKLVAAIDINQILCLFLGASLGTPTTPIGPAAPISIYKGDDSRHPISHCISFLLPALSLEKLEKALPAPRPVFGRYLQSALVRLQYPVETWYLLETLETYRLLLHITEYIHQALSLLNPTPKQQLFYGLCLGRRKLQQRRRSTNRVH